MAHLLKTSYHQNPHIGLYTFANDRVCFIPNHISPKQEIEIMNVLRVPVHKMGACGTSLLGVFLAGNSKKILLPYIMFDGEIEMMKKLGIAYHILPTDHTALGNNIVATDDACIIHPALEPFKSEIKKELGVSRIDARIMGGIPTIGSLIVLNSRGCLLSALASDDDEAFVAKFFRLPVTRGTVNLGSPYVHSGIATNSQGFIFGNRTGGPEAVHIDEALGFLK